MAMGFMEANAGKPLPPTIANGRLESMSLQEQPHLYRAHVTNAHHPRMDRPISARTMHVVLEPTLRTKSRIFFKKKINTNYNNCF